MYTPVHNRETDRAKIVEFMREYPFAILITTRDGKMTATHLPVLIDERSMERTPFRSDESSEIFLVAHLARANTQWMDFAAGNDALIIFQEPHAFISTRYYEKPLSVPTWNYVAVHAYGQPRILESMEQRLGLVRRMVEQFEGNLLQWESLPNDFKRTKATGIVAFEMQVTRLDARFKLSQDRTRVEQENIVTALTARDENVEFEIGAMMREKLESVQAASV